MDSLRLFIYQYLHQTSIIEISTLDSTLILNFIKFQRTADFKSN